MKGGLKNMNKKIFMFGIPLLCLALVSAGVMLYYGQINTTVTVTQPINIIYNGTAIEGIIEENIDCNAGDSCLGGLIIIRNNGETDRTVSMSSTEIEGISVKYINHLAEEFINGEVIIPEGNITTVFIKYSPDKYLLGGSQIIIETTIE